METSTFELGVLERMLLVGLLAPIQGDITRLRQMREFREGLSFTDVEIKEFGIKAEPDGNVTWQNGKVKLVEINGEFQEIIKRQLTQLNKSELLTQDHVPLYEMFVGG